MKLLLRKNGRSLKILAKLSIRFTMKDKCYDFMVTIVYLEILLPDTLHIELVRSYARFNCDEDEKQQISNTFLKF